MLDHDIYSHEVAKLTALISVVCAEQPVSIVISALIDLICMGIENQVPEQHKQLTRLECIQYLMEDTITDEQIKVLA